MSAKPCTFVMLLLLLHACGGETKVAPVVVDVPTPPAIPPAQPPNRPPPIPIGNFTVTGEVFSSVDGAISAPVNIWIQTPGIGYSWWWAHGGKPPPSDSSGRFTASELPEAEVTFLAFADGYVQPCAINPRVTSDMIVRLEVMSRALLDSVAPPRPTTGAPPELTGTVYENTPEGRRPIAGASIWVEKYMDVGMATTVSARDGSYYLCNLGADVFMYVSREGFREKWIPVQATQSLQLDIELERL